MWYWRSQTNVCTGGPFLDRPSKLTGPVSYFEIKVSRKLGSVLTSNEVQNFWNSLLEGKIKQLNGPGNYRELREMGPRCVYYWQMHPNFASCFISKVLPMIVLFTFHLKIQWKNNLSHRVMFIAAKEETTVSVRICLKRWTDRCDETD